MLLLARMGITVADLQATPTAVATVPTFAEPIRQTSRQVEFCDGCGQVCTATRRAEARRDRTRSDALRAFPFAR